MKERFEVYKVISRCHAHGGVEIFEFVIEYLVGKIETEFENTLGSAG